jgi:hypothetical protein
MRRFPAGLWLLVYVGSVIILNGSHPRWDPWELAAGIALPIIAFGLGVYLAAGPWPGRPRVRGLYWFLSATFAFYAVTALVALFALGIDEAIAVLLAGIIPMTAVALWLAEARQRTRVAPNGRLIDESRDDDRDATPGLGVDDSRPLGDTPDAHSDLIPQDLPKDHPGREAAEQQAAARGGGTRGHRDGGAAAEPGHDADPGAPELGDDEERDGARFGRGERAPRASRRKSSRR